MERTEILEQLTGIFREVPDDESLTLTPELTAEDVPQWDSFNHINIVVGTEMQFGIKFRIDELEQLRNVGEFVKLIDRKLKDESR
jgi:acyl carrier protein